METKGKVLVTGSSGFIGFHLCQLLLINGYQVIGIDNFNDYYDVQLKEERNRRLINNSKFISVRGSIEDVDLLKSIFKEQSFDYVINLAAQAGVRYSMVNPFAYTSSNITGFVNILERCKDHHIKHLVFASSSSVYGANTNMPFSESSHTEHPLSLYAATKKANELIAHSYANSFGLPVTGLRFFTVYGPWGRPDMALFLFTKAIIEGKSIDVYNNGEMTRDFTYVSDIVKGVFNLMTHVPEPDKNWQSDNPNPESSFLPYRIFNIGNNNPVPLMSFIKAIEKNLRIQAKINFMPIQTGDVPNTFADVSKLEQAIGFKPETKVEDGIREFVNWFRDYYKM